MKFKKIILSIASVLIILAIMLQNDVFAAEQSVYLGIVAKGESDYGYAIEDPNNGGSQIWNTVKYNGASSTSGYDRSVNAYCARAGQGFGSVTGVANSEPLEYKNVFNMRTQKDTVLSNNILVTANTTVNGTSVKCYDAILALSDLLYLKSNSQSEKEELIAKALQEYGEYEYADYTYKITNDDIIAVQQAALWYFTNYDQSKYNLREDTHWLYYMKGNDSNFHCLNDYKPNGLANDDEGPERTAQAEALYKYLIETALKNAANSNYVGKNKVTLYTNLNALSQTQPIIIIEKGENKKFDLALRKYITKVDGVEVTNSRVPNVDTVNTLDAGQETASYKHRKDPVVVKKGSVVTYKLTIYNEGEKVGRATKIVDQLPAGLKFSKVVSGSFAQESYNESTNKLTLKRVDGNETNLDAYTQGNLKSETIEIECTVTAEPDAQNNKILTNIAWIEEEYNAADNITITNKEGEDRDSEPTNHPNKTANELVTSNNGYTGKNTETNLSNSNYYYEGEQDDDDFEKLLIKPISSGSYNIVLVKEDSDGEQLNSQATFEVDGVEKTVVGRLEIVSNKQITASNVNTQDTYTIKELVPPDEYCKFTGTINITVTKKQEGDSYIVEKVEYTVTDENGKDITEETNGKADVYLNEDGNIYVEVKNYQFDLALIKRITEVNGVAVPERIKNVDITKLANGTETTADYNLDKTPVAVKKGDIVTYTFRTYNEGEIDGYAAEITEDIPEGLEFIYSTKTGNELEEDTTLTEEEREAIKFNQQYLWSISKIDDNNKITEIKTDYLSKNTSDSNLIKAFDKTKAYSNTNPKNPDYKEVSVMFKVVSDDITGSIIRNEACISKDTDKNGAEIDDRDSDPDEWVKYEDDEDYDNIILNAFDLSLRKFIVAISKDETIENTEYMRNSDGTYTRAPQVDTSKLNTKDEDGNLITTATYNHTKEPVQVQKGDYVVYMLRVYNEGNLEGFASEIKDHLPEYLEYVDGEYNKKYGWEVSEDGRTVTTKYLSDDKYLLEAATEKSGVITLDYKDVPIMCRVKDTAKTSEKITNIADITIYEDENHKEIKDRDSIKDNVKLPEDKDLPSYKDDETGDYIPGQEDDDDFEKVIVKRFDLALRKFITEVNDKNVDTRIPQVKYENGKITYEHTKDPVDVVTDDIVTYTIRVYNEGEIKGYASKVSDDLPDGLEFLPENELNKEMRWVMYDKDGNETQDVTKATKITTDYLSKEQGEERMKKDESLKENPNLLKAFDRSKEISDTNPDYKEVKIAFKVVEPNGSSKILVNAAQITDDTDENGDPIDDDDSIPDEWNEGEDDQDKEYVKLTNFDLALRKWVTQAIVIENGKETVTNTGHQPYDDPEGIVKVELHRKKLDQVTVKFRYSIRVINEGDIEGYAKEVTDYIPEGLKFVAEDNPGWTDEGNNVISTRLLENTLLKPGEYADVEVLLTWINGKDNMGLKTNTAEISEDYNEKGIPDKDSTPDNKKPGEDDIDDAPVMLSVSTGQARIYFVLGFTVLITVAGGIVLIKKYVL